MTAPRLEVRLDRIEHNTRVLVDRLRPLGIVVSGVTKAALGSPEVAGAFLAGGATSLGESRIENVERLRHAGITVPITLVRSPMLSQADRVVASADSSLNSELDVVAGLSAAAGRQHRNHGVVLMVELGDLREGILPGALNGAVRTVLDLPGLVVRGIGTNLACHSGVIPDEANMAELGALAGSVERAFGISLAVVSGGNSANLPWALAAGVDVGRVNHLRLGESLLLGREPIDRTVVDGLDPGAFSLVGEVIESGRKPSLPRGGRGQAAFGLPQDRQGDGTDEHRVIVALGRQDLDVDGVVAPPGFEVLGASSDHLVLRSEGAAPVVGSELRFDVDYSALLRAMTSPSVARRYLRSGPDTTGSVVW